MTEEEREKHRQAAFDMDMDEKTRTWLRAQRLANEDLKEILETTEKALREWGEQFKNEQSEVRRMRRDAESGPEQPTNGTGQDQS